VAACVLESMVPEEEKEEEQQQKQEEEGQLSISL
jgi:hypothetical protein